MIYHDIMTARIINTVNTAINYSVTIRSINIMQCRTKYSVMSICFRKDNIYVGERKRKSEGGGGGELYRGVYMLHSAWLFLYFIAYIFVYTL